MDKVRHKKFHQNPTSFTFLNILYIVPINNYHRDQCSFVMSMGMKPHSVKIKARIQLLRFY